MTSQQLRQGLLPDAGQVMTATQVINKALRKPGRNLHPIELTPEWLRMEAELDKGPVGLEGKGRP